MLALTPIGDPDMWFHLRTGQWIVENSELPGETDPFAYTSPPLKPYQVRGLRTQWLGQVVFYLIFDALGPKGLSIVRSLALVMPFGIFFLIALRRGGNPLALLFVAGAPMFVMAHALSATFERPQAFSFLLTPAAYALSMRLRRGFSLPHALGLCLMMAIWANLHGGYIVGVAVIGSIAIGAACALIAGRLGYGGLLGEPPGSPGKFFGTMAAAIAASMINPAGNMVHKWAVALVGRLMNPVSTGGLRQGDVMTGIREYHSVWSLFGDPTMGWLYFVVACYALAVAALALKFISRRRIDLAEALSLGVLVFFGMAYLKGIAFAMIFTSFIATASVPYIAGRRRMTVLASGGVLIIAALTGSLIMEKPWMLHPSPIGYWINKDYPESALRFLDEKAVEGRMYNIMSWGGYIIWRSYPDRQVFFDGREISSNVMRLYRQVFEAKPGWRETLKAYDVDILLVPVLSSGKVVYPLIFSMAIEGPGPWRLVFLDHNQAVFVREGARGTQRATECCEMPFERIYSQLVDVAAIRLLDSPGHPDIMLSQAFGLFWSGRNAEALAVIDAMPVRNPVSERLRGYVVDALSRGKQAEPSETR